MQAHEFERVLAFTSTREKTQAIARDYLVARHSLDTITTTFGTTKQNVFRSVSKLIEDAEIAQETIVKVRSVFSKLNVPKRQYDAAHAFFFTSKSLDEIAQQINSTVEDVLKIARCTIKQYQIYANQDAIKEREVEFDKILRYGRAGAKSIQICYDYFVIQDTMTGIAEKHEITKQNTYNIIKRFEEARARYEAENPPKPKRRKITKP
ncbi:hypothetical protein Nstercoris_02277 (plasmid) [Nitrosomonas stercoris]|uniref:Uncharacterized protein n=1 Tax=Nitrosomonas stercoris TaxID=1444684 RepID=A0A4Y1YQ86_9PROT|nr:hypothetical protein Nstercoris_02277 [Nitrosomonas stercoris]